MVAFIDAVQELVLRTPDIKVATLFGSQARRLAGNAALPVDSGSDVDLQIVSTNTSTYREPGWVKRIEGFRLDLYAARSVVGATKYTAVCGDAVLDLVVVSYHRLNFARRMFQVGADRLLPVVKRGLVEYSDTFRFGQRVIKGGQTWEEFNTHVVRRYGRARLSDSEITNAGFLAFVDTQTILRRIEKGEFLAAQRILHNSLLETNFRLLMEWRERHGLIAYHRARRAEAILSDEELRLVSFAPGLESTQLKNAAINALCATGRLVELLCGSRPSWPPLGPLSNSPGLE